MSLFQSSLLTLALAFASAMASIAGYLHQVAAADASAPPAQPGTEPTESPAWTVPNGSTPTTPSPVAPNPVAISERLPKGVDWNAGDLLVLVSGFDLDLVSGSRFLDGLGTIDKDWKSELVGGSVYAVGKSDCRRWGNPPMPADFFSSGQFPEAVETLRTDLGAIRAVRAGAEFRTLVVYYSSVAPDEAELNAFDDATLYWCGRAVEDQRVCEVLNRLFPRPRFITGGTLNQSAPNTAFENWRTAIRKK